MKIQKYIKRTHNISFKYAFEGIIYAIRTQPNFVYHLIFLNLSIIIGILYKISYTEFLVILLIGSIVLTAEMINTSIEALSDFVADGKTTPLIKIVKDVSAGAVLISSLMALILGIIIFVPKMIVLFEIVK